MTTDLFPSRKLTVAAPRFAWVAHRGAVVHTVGANGRTFCQVENRSQTHLTYGNQAPAYLPPCSHCAQYERGT